MTAAWSARSLTGAGPAWAWRLLFTIHIPVIALPPYYVLKYSASVTGVGEASLVILLSAAAGALQVRHSVAAMRGGRPYGWQWTLAALAALAYLPLSAFQIQWGVVQAMVIASGLMLLGPRRGAVLAAVVLTIATAVSVHTFVPKNHGHLDKLAYNSGNGVLFDLIVGVALYGAVRLVHVLDELETARSDLADLAVSHERLRVSRDLHDLLGQSLSAVSLKGDLAIRLMDRDPVAARAEIQGLASVARQALRGVRAIMRDEHVTTLADEADGALALLTAADIAATVLIDLPTLARQQEAVLAWAVREAVTNVLRHSEATTCEVRASARNGLVTLIVANDGASPPRMPGTGLTGLAERARSVGGSLSSARSPDGWFRLQVQLPDRVVR